jgi:galactose mutarotase-like enzyme
MTALRLVLLVVLANAFASPVLAQRYSAVREGEIIRLTDRTSDIAVAIMPPAGNIAFEMRVHGQNVLRGWATRSRTVITNSSAEAMPVAVGFHPYFQLTDSPRDEWTIALGARTQWKLNANKVPTWRGRFWVRPSGFGK